MKSISAYSSDSYEICYLFLALIVLFINLLSFTAKFLFWLANFLLEIFKFFLL